MPPKWTGRRLFFVLFSLAVTASIFAYLLSTVSPSEVIALLRGLSGRWFALFVVLSLAGSLFRTWRYRLLLGVSGYQPGVTPLFLITLVRNFFADLLPARLGTLIYIYLVQSRLNIPFGAAASSFAHDFLFDLVSLSFLVTGAVLIQSSGMISPLVIIAGALVLALASIGVLLLLPRILQGLARLTPILPLLSSRIRQALQASLADTAGQVVYTKKAGVFWRLFALSMGVRCCKYLSLYVLLLGLVAPLGYDAKAFPLARVFLGLCSAELSASLPVSGIAGFGAYEGAWVLVFQLLGYPERLAALTSISHHLLTQVYGYCLGGLALLILLLPVFAGKTRPEGGGHTAAARFWGVYGATVAGIALLFLLLVPAGGKIPAAQGDGARNGGNVVAPPPPFPLDRVTGKLVYQRPDGIYGLDLQKKQPKRIVPFGTSPRWSSDGRQLALINQNSIMVGKSGEGLREVATAEKPKVVCFTPDGRALLFTDGRRLRRVELATGEVTDLLTDEEILELDMDDTHWRVAFTVKALLGYRVKVFDLRSRQLRTVATGCSASIAPDGSMVTVNGSQHDELYLYDWDNLRRVGVVGAPAGKKFDNQRWSNHPRLLVATSEVNGRDIFLLDRQSGEFMRLTDSGDCDRADLYVTGVLP